MPLGQIILHFPQSMHPLSNTKALFSCPSCIISIALLRLTSAKLPPLHVAVHNPQAIHLRNPDSNKTILVNLSLSRLSRSILELGDIEYPKLIISIYSDRYLCTAKAADRASFNVSGIVLGPVTVPAKNIPFILLLILFIVGSC